MQPEERHWASLYRELHEHSGIDLSLYKQDQTRRRLLALAIQWGAKDLDEFGRRVASDELGMSRLLEHLAINVTSMFRNPERWRTLEEEILPDLVARSPALSVWSAGCSLGAEPYSLAALLYDRWPGLHRILATDVDPGALRQARSGCFSEADVASLPRESLRGLFEPCEGGVRANHALRRMVSVLAHNLLEPPPQKGFDLILCRNVVIYFNDEAKSVLYRRFFDVLQPGGCLLIGNTERIFDAGEIGFESRHTCFYRKPDGGIQQWRHAS